jgi:CubicO group peptidase (beta-lactamase class C family)
MGRRAMTSVKFRPAVALLLRLASASAAPKVERGEIVRGETGRKLDEHAQRLGFFGSVLVARKGEILLNKGYGVMDAAERTPMRPDAMWDWASVTKQFTAAAILKLEMRKKLPIDDSIRKHFKNAPKDKEPVTIRHLLNHRSGIRQPNELGVDPRKRDAVVGAFLALPVAWEPGSRWEYSNLSYWVLGALIERLSGRPSEKFCIEELFLPAGMEDACFTGSPGLDLARVPKDDRGRGVHFAYGYEMSWGCRASGGGRVAAGDAPLGPRAPRRSASTRWARTTARSGGRWTGRWAARSTATAAAWARRPRRTCAGSTRTSSSRWR